MTRMLLLLSFVTLCALHTMPQLDRATECLRGFVDARLCCLACWLTSTCPAACLPAACGRPACARAGGRGSRTPEEGADTAVWLALLPAGARVPSGGMLRDRTEVGWADSLGIELTS